MNEMANGNDGKNFRRMMGMVTEKSEKNNHRPRVKNGKHMTNEERYSDRRFNTKD